MHVACWHSCLTNIGAAILRDPDSALGRTSRYSVRFLNLPTIYNDKGHPHTPRFCLRACRAWGARCYYSFNEALLCSKPKPKTRGKKQSKAQAQEGKLFRPLQGDGGVRRQEAQGGLEKHLQKAPGFASAEVCGSRASGCCSSLLTSELPPPAGACVEAG